MQKTVLITGANHGLGLSLVRVFLNNNFMVFAGIYKPNGYAQINEISDNDRLHLVDMDISDISSVKKAAVRIGELTKSIDILINNAGVISNDEITDIEKTIFNELDFDSIRDVININAVGSLRVANTFAPLLKNGVNRLIVNISSEAGSISNCYRNEWFGYCMSKAALNMAGNIIHNEFKKHGGQVLQIHPGYLQTYMSGEKNEQATYTSDFAAENIFVLIQNIDRHRSPKAIFIDLFGNKMEW